MSNDLPAMPPAPEEEPRQREPESVTDTARAQAPAAHPGIETAGEAGARLAQLRTQRGMSLEDVSSRLKVAVTKLKALEAGDLSRLQDATFTLGVVRSYAKILGADPEPIVRVLRRAYGTSEQDLSMPASSGASLPRGKMSVNWRGAQPRRSGRGWLWGIGLVVVVIVLVVAFRDGRQSNWLSRFKSKGSETATVADNTAAATPASGASDALWPASGAETGASVDNGTPSDAASAPAAQTQTDTQAAAPAASDAQAVAPTVAPAAVAPAVAPVAVAPAVEPVASAGTASSLAAAGAGAGHNAVAAGATAAASAAAAPEAAQPGAPVTLTFKVTEDSWISVRGLDGREIFSGLVHPGDGQQIEGKRPVNVTVGNVHGIDTMDIDGEQTDLKQYLSSTGNVAHFTLR